MYFEIENTPEHIRKARRTEVVQKRSPKEECPRLVLAPFSRPPQVVFEDVLLGTTCERELEIFNPTKQEQQITLGKALPAGLVIQLPGEWLVLEPETCYTLMMAWTPMQPTALRETIRFTNEQRGRYDVIIVLKSVTTLKGKNQPKVKVCPGKVTKKVGKKSPVAIYKKKAEVIYNSTKIKETIIQSTHYNVLKPSNKDNLHQYSDIQTTHGNVLKPSNKDNIPRFSDYSMDYQPAKCPFDSPTSVDFTFDTSEIFSNMRKTHTNALQNTYDKSCISHMNSPESVALKPMTKQVDNKRADISASDLFDNLTFTPLKVNNPKSDKLNKGPKIILSLNSESELDDSLDPPSKENATHSIICVTTTQTTNQWQAIQHDKKQDYQFTETVQNKKIPNTSSPKELNSPNFSINTEFSRISDLSFVPQRFSTERKALPKLNNDTHDLFEDPNAKLNSDTYTKDSPNTPLDFRVNQMCEAKPLHNFMREQHKVCRQALFREQHHTNHAQQYYESYDRNYLNPSDINVWNREIKVDSRSPPRSITPPLQSIPEESTYLQETLDKTDKRSTFTSTFTMNKTFDKGADRSLISNSAKLSWSKRSIRAETELWKIPTAPPRKSLKPKASINNKESLGIKLSTSENIKNCSQNVTLNQIGNVYSQSSTVDPFLSASYFYDEEAVHKCEEEFKRWLNYILTPPADLESNVEQKVDVGNWLQNKNKEVPAAPTKEQVCSAYHNSRRLESLRRAARAMILNPEMAQVFQKLSVQIEKKLIAIRPDRNLHLDVGLQKIIMELLLSYNPLWLRIGLEAIYGIILPLKSNSDIDGLTTFIIQRMFKNPFLKNKHSKSSAPNMLLPAYMEAVKKFTLKKFFMLVFFLDQAKQKKLISHDPCLFCRNAVCKESREIIIRFTRELIAGIGDITKHLRPIGYIVCHKQSYLDEYKYAVHNIALDIRDGVRLTKVMEIILMKNGLLNQLRTPAISRLQKVHNVQVALTALKEANFVIVGDITAQDIADGHREKTLSLLWQLIHVLRAPLFERAANVIQTWWKKKYEVILEKRKEEERVRQKLNTAASVIQCWWRRVQYNRLVEWQMKQITIATIVLQKYCRMWICRTRLRIQKRSVLKIEDWYRSLKMMRKAKVTLETLKAQKEELRRKSATTLQSYVRRWLCVKEYQKKVQKIVLIQSIIRCFITRKRYLLLKESTLYVQRCFRGKLQMKADMKKFLEIRKAAIVIQSYYKMIKERKYFNTLKNAVRTIEERYIALRKMRTNQKDYQELRRHTILIQAKIRGNKCRKEYLKQKNLIIKLQKKFKAHLLMKKNRRNFLHLKKAAITLQQHVRSYQLMKKCRQDYTQQRTAAILIQRRLRAQKSMKTQKYAYVQLKKSAIIIQNHYRALLAMRQQRFSYSKLRNAAILIQRRWRAQILMKNSKHNYEKLRSAVTTVQRRFRAKLKTKEAQSKYIKLKSSCIILQRTFRAFIQGKQQRQKFLQQKQAAIVIQNWLRSNRKRITVQQEFKTTKQACVTIQRVYRAYIIGRKERQNYLIIRTATLRIQNYYRSYIEMKRVREHFIQLKTATVTIQRFYKTHLKMKKQRKEYQAIKSATIFIQRYYRRFKETKMITNEYITLKKTAISIQRKYRSICAMRKQRIDFLKLKNSAICIQRRCRALLTMRLQRLVFLKMRTATILIQTWFRARCLTIKERSKYLVIRNACVTIQRIYKSYVAGKRARQQYLTLRKSVVLIQQHYRALLAMKKERKSYLTKRAAAINIQRRFRAQRLMKTERSKYLNAVKASTTIQRRYRAYIEGKRQRLEYIQIVTSIITIQTWFRSILETRQVRNRHLQLKTAVVQIQHRYRAILEGRKVRQQYLIVKSSIVILQANFRKYILRRRFLTMKNAALKIQRFYRSYKLAQEERHQYIQVRICTIKLQSYVRSYIQRQRYLRIRNAVKTLQAAYRWKKQRDLHKIQRENAAICIQKNFRRYLAQSRFQYYREKVVYVQKVWRGKLVTRLLRCEFLQKKRAITKLQARIRGYLVRKYVQHKKKEIQELREKQRRNWAATVIQAYYRGYKVCEKVNTDPRVANLRRRWRMGALKSTQESLKERHDYAMEALEFMTDINTIIRAFRSLELLTEVFPMMYDKYASTIASHVYFFMSVTNRSISSIELLKSAAALLVNLTRYRITGPLIYSRQRIPPILKFMCRFSNSETQLFCILCTYLWLFSKYDGVKEDLTEFLNIPENLKSLQTIKSNVDRMMRMAQNVRSKLHTPQSTKFVRHIKNSDRGQHIILPALEPDYGITRADKPKYFEDPYQAISCLFQTYIDSPHCVSFL